MDPQKKKRKKKEFLWPKLWWSGGKIFPYKLHVCTGGFCQMFFSSSSHPHLTVLFIYQICTCRLDGLRKSSSSCNCRRRGSSEVKAFLSWNAAINKTCIILSVRLASETLNPLDELIFLRIKFISSLKAKHTEACLTVQMYSLRSIYPASLRIDCFGLQMHNQWD